GHWSRTGPGLPDSGFVVSLAIAPSEPQILYAGTRNGLARTDDGGAAWAEVDTGLTDRYVEAIAVDPTDPAVVYAGTRLPGAFRSTDAGLHWHHASVGLGGAAHATGLVVDPSNPQTLYVADDGGVGKSTDGATSWVRM